MLELQGLGFRAQGRQLLDGFSLAFPDPGLYILRGPAGSGKSLLARVMAGLCRPQSGQVRLDGHEIYPRLGIYGGSIFFADGRADFAELETVEEYSAAVLQGLGSRKQLRAVLERLALHVPRPAEAEAALLPDGHFALLEIALACVCGWRLIVLDGQLSRLDGDSLRQALDWLRELALRQESLVVCTASASLREIPQEAQLHSLTGALPVEVLPDREQPVAGAAQQEALSEGGGRVLRIKLGAAEQPMVLTSGRHYAILARREGWLRVQLSGSIDEMLQELEGLGVSVSALEFVQ
ncbi:ATP-binding cassette domain-containing protein [bacterium]|nr:ATP-binding cassette domain-containing protein [bacterium]